jgi:dTDP-4-dehydrorhamnose reductase
MKVLIAGAAGQLGRSLQEVLSGHEVVAGDRDWLDITRLADVRAALAAHRPEVVINAAAYNLVDRAETDRDAAFALNETGPRHLAVASGEAGAAIVHVSTDYVFDGTATAPYDEDATPNPRSVYGRSKLAGERAVIAGNPRHYVVRTAWLYHEEGQNFPLTMLAAGRKGPVRVVDDQVGSPTYALHLARGLARLIETGAFGLRHVAGSGGASWYELTRALYRRVGLATEVTPVKTSEFPRPAPRPAYSVLTSRREPRVALPPWEQGLDEFVARLRARGLA